MPERSFGRTVRYRRTKLGLSQAKLGELVGRSTTTIRSWERDKSRPNDAKVLSALAAILGVDERQLFEKAEVERPAVVETSPTVEQALATLSIRDDWPQPVSTTPEQGEPIVEEGDESERDGSGDVGPYVSPEPELEQIDDVKPTAPRPISVPQTPPPPVPVVRQREVAFQGDDPAQGGVSWDIESSPGDTGKAAYVAPPEPYVQTPLLPTLADVSYMEDQSQRQLYRVRSLATVVAFVALVVAFVWAVGEGLGALGDWWNDFFGNLRL
ncbi:MAG TPA: helix-turn-helix domain-containing protein [Acidimicrobiia bacterium]|nr:helix-turn-helix domain-containing protein [Acidimicrobiia bacterium]